MREVFGVKIDEGALEREVVRILDEGGERDAIVAGIAEVRSSLLSFDAQEGMDHCATVSERVAHVISSMAREGKTSTGEVRQGAENA